MTGTFLLLKLLQTAVLKTVERHSEKHNPSAWLASCTVKMLCAPSAFPSAEWTAPSSISTRVRMAPAISRLQILAYALAWGICTMQRMLPGWCVHATRDRQPDIIQRRSAVKGEKDAICRGHFQHSRQLLLLDVASTEARCTCFR